MAKFKYRGRDSYGKVVEGRLEAASVEDLEATLKKRGLIPLKIEKTEEGGLEGLLFKFFGKEEPILNLCFSSQDSLQQCLKLDFLLQEFLIYYLINHQQKIKEKYQKR